MSPESVARSPESSGVRHARSRNHVPTPRHGLRTPDSGPRTSVGVQLPLLPEDEPPPSPAPGPGYDRVPELTHYQDEGCRVWAACLTCPLPRCIFDDPAGVRRATNRAVNGQRDAEIRRRYAAGEAAIALAAEFGLGRRTVYRIVERGT